MGFIQRRLDVVGGTAEFPTGTSYADRLFRSKTILTKAAEALIACNVGWQLDTNKSASTTDYANIPDYSGTEPAYAGRMELEIKEVSGTVGVHNVSSLTVTVAQANIAVCSSNLATVITVYDSSNNSYNAFKYTSDGTDYYYVLDGVQTDWTDDLASIGYKLPIVAAIIPH